MTTEKRYNEVKTMIDQVKDISLIDILEHFGIEKRNGLWQCPNPLHDDSIPSCKYYESTNTLHCFGCNQTWDSIKLWGDLNHQDTTYEFFDICEDLLKFADITIKQYYVKKNKQIKEKEVENKQKSVDNYLSFIISYDSIKDSIRKHAINEYFKKRHINFDKVKQICDKNGIKICHNYYKNVNSIIINDNNKLLLQRQIEDYLKDDDSKSHQKFVHGNSDISILSSNSDVLIICEGIYDAFSLITLYNKDIDVISLNSVNNKEKILNDSRIDLKKYRMIYVCTDNDDAGKNTNRYLIDNIYLSNENVKKWNIKGYENYKDINEYLISNY